MSETVIGGTGPDNRTAEQHAADAAWLARRTAIQAFFNANEADPPVVMAAMAQYGVSAQELSDCMDYRLNITRYLRGANCEDGFGGLKVWPDDVVCKFMDWQAAQPNPFGGGTLGQGKPVDYANKRHRLDVMDTLDRVARLVKWRADNGMETDNLQPWLGDWRAAMAVTAAEQAAYQANLMAQPKGNTVIGPG